MKQFEDLDLTMYNSYRLHAVGKTVFFPESEEDLVELYRQSTDYILLGSGHNIILANPYYEKPMIIFNGNYNAVQWDGEDGLEVEAGAMMHDVAQVALDYALSGVEVFYDIPSSLGGAVVMNAGAGGEEVKDGVVKVRYLDLQDLQIKEIVKEGMSLECRNSFFQRST